MQKKVEERKKMLKNKSQTKATTGQDVSMERSEPPLGKSKALGERSKASLKVDTSMKKGNTTEVRKDVQVGEQTIDSVPQMDQAYTPSRIEEALQRSKSTTS